MPGGAERPFQLARLRRDGAFRTEVLYCYEHGIPHKEFLARWDPEDRAKVVAAAIEKSERCTLCGTADYEWQEARDAYEPVLTECQGCAHKQRFQEGNPQAKDAPGMSVRLVSRAEADRLRFDPKVAKRGPRRRRERRRQQ